MSSLKAVTNTHTWISLWFLVSTPVVVWDALYCFLRPRSMVGGDLHWIWKPYAIQAGLDYVYGLPSFERGDGFTNAQSALNILESVVNVVYLYLAHVSPSPLAPLVGWGAAVMTLSKTILYWAQEYYCGFCATGHNAWAKYVLLWMVPNGLWIVIPAIIVYVLGRDLAASLGVAYRVPAVVRTGKKD